MVRVRMKDVDPSPLRYAVASETRGIVTVRNGKGDKDRTTILPELLRGVVVERKVELWGLFEEDPAAGLAGTWLPEALARKHPLSGEKWPGFAKLCRGKPWQ